MPSSLPGRQPTTTAVGGAKTLHLDHPLALAGPVGGLELLRDHALAGGQPALGAAGRVGVDRRQLGRARVVGALDQLGQALAALREGCLQQLLAARGQQVEGAVDRRGLLGEHVDPRLGRVDPVLERIEDLGPVLPEDHELAVGDVPPGREAELGEVAGERLAVSRLDEHVVPVDEHHGAEPVVLRLVRPLLALGQRLPRQRELGLDGRLQGQGHPAIVVSPGARLREQLRLGPLDPRRASAQRRREGSGGAGSRPTMPTVRS